MEGQQLSEHVPDGQWTVRSLSDQDQAMTFAWRRDSETCAASENQLPPTREEHLAWMADRLSPEGPVTFIVLRNECAVGMFTVIERNVHNVSIGYTVAPDHRGLGYARAVRGEALAYIKRTYRYGILLTSKIRVGNARSIATALKMGANLVRLAEGFVYLDQVIS